MKGVSLSTNALHLPPDVANQAQRPVAGVMLAGYGSYVNASMVAKLEVAQQGRDWFVIAYLNSPNAELGGNVAFLTPPLESEAEAARQCDVIAQAVYVAFSAREEGGAWWRYEMEPGRLVSSAPVPG